MKLKVNESGYNHKKFNLITKDEYDYWFNAGLGSFKRGDKCILAHNKEFMDYMSKHSAKIGSTESKKTNQIGNAWTDGWTYGNIHLNEKLSIRESNSIENLEQYDDTKDILLIIDWLNENGFDFDYIKSNMSASWFIINGQKRRIPRLKPIKKVVYDYMNNIEEFL